MVAYKKYERIVPFLYSFVVRDILHTTFTLPIQSLFHLRDVTWVYGAAAAVHESGVELEL